MKRKKNILIEAVVLLIAVAMFTSTIAVTADTVKERFSKTCMTTHTVEEQKGYIDPTSFHNMESIGGPTLWLQEPDLPDSWYAYTSDLNSPFRCYDNFWAITETICDVHWWGVVRFWTGSEWIPCNCQDMKFDIVFFTDQAGEPGDPVCMYEDVTPECTFYDYYDAWTGYEWSYDLDPCCELDQGWISIAGAYHPEDCWFLWMGSPYGDGICLQEGDGWLDDDLAFKLTARDQCEQLCCDGTLEWSNIKPGKIVTGTFEVWNCGCECSYLCWVVDSWPEWGRWTFNPSSGTLHSSENVTVQVTVDTTGLAQEETFTGKVIIKNCNNPDETCEIDIILTTTRTRSINTQFLNWIQNHLNMFPILRLLLQRLGLQN
jgi:hypothetical protein